MSLLSEQCDPPVKMYQRFRMGCMDPDLLEMVLWAARSYPYSIIRVSNGKWKKNILKPFALNKPLKALALRVCHIPGKIF